jgi:hypothetical protein
MMSASPSAHALDRETAEEVWQLRGASADPRRAAPDLHGLLAIRPGLIGSVLTVAIDEPRPGSPFRLMIEARLTAVDGLGDWRLEGTALVDGRRVTVDLQARHHGLFRHGERLTAWLSLQATLVGQKGSRTRRLLDLEVNAEAIR